MVSLYLFLEQQLHRTDLRLLPRYWADWQTRQCEKWVQLYHNLRRNVWIIFHILFKVPRSKALVARNMGCTLSLTLGIMSSASRSHSPPGLKVPVTFHFVSHPGLRNDQWSEESIFACLVTGVDLSRHTCSFGGLLHMMSLYIDMKMILPWSCSVYVENLQRCESWENHPLEFHRLSIDSIQFSVLRQALKPILFWFPILCLTRWTDGLSQDTLQDLKIHKLVAFERLITSSSFTRHRFHMQRIPNLFLTLLRFPIFTLESSFESHRTISLQLASQLYFWWFASSLSNLVQEKQLLSLMKTWIFTK